VTDVDAPSPSYLERSGFALLIDTPVGEDMRVVR
jgi:hypothetical protein